MTKTTDISNFSKVLTEELEKYTKEVGSGIEKMSGELAKYGAKQINVSAKSTFKGDNSSGYATGWTAKNQSTRGKISYVIHNKNAPSLAHLLEYGHALTKGGRTRAFPHIKPIEEQIIKDYEDNVIAIIERGY